MSLVKDLGKLLKDCGMVATFDPYRDNTKGCGEQCKGWNPKASGWCVNHRNAMFSGDYLADGELQKMYQDELKLRQEKIDGMVKIYDRLSDENIIINSALRRIGKGECVFGADDGSSDYVDSCDHCIAHAAFNKVNALDVDASSKGES